MDYTMGRRKKRLRAEVKVRYHQEDVIKKRTEQLCNVVEPCSSNAVVDEQAHDSNMDFLDAVASDCEYSDGESEPSSTQHYRRLQRAEDAWAKLREGILTTTLEHEGSLFGQTCHFCNSEAGVCRCLDCGSTIAFCEACAILKHSKFNILHRVEILRDCNMYFPLSMEQTLMLERHQCLNTTSSNVHFREIVVVDSRGYQTEVKVQFCNCEPDFLRLLRFNLWGATPTKPELAFTLDLMKLLHTLNLECQVAVKDFCAALQTLRDDVISLPNQRKLYPVVIDSLEEFRIYRHKLCTLNFVTSAASDHVNAIDCPACPKNQGTLIESMDALFIGRKKSAGKSVRNPLFGTVVFDDDSKVEQFVQQYPTTRKANEACSEFLAGDALRSRSRYSALSETAIFGRACRHEFPKKFINMKHGERLAYPVWILNSLLDETDDKSIDVHVLYDIACLLETHLEAQGKDDVLQCVKFAIPIFHSYGHKAKCQALQIKYSPRRVPGFGLTDGEVLERLWSFLRRFGKMTKEMRPNHRVDVLSDALLFYARKRCASLGQLLIDRMKKANRTIKESEEELTKLLDSLPAPVRREDVAEWANQEEEWTAGLHNTVEQASWKHGYVIYLKMFYEIHSKWEQASEPEKMQQLYRQLNRLEGVLVDLESRNGIARRWTTACEEYQLARDASNDRNKKMALTKVHTKVIERWFLLSLKAKYAEGHALAKRLSKQISQATKTLHVAVEDFNKVDCSTQWPLPRSLQVDEVKNPEADLWLRTEFMGSSSPVPISVKRKAVDLYNLLDRAKEEITLLQADMKNVMDHFSEQHAIFSNSLTEASSRGTSAEAKGRVVYISMKLLSLESHLVSLYDLFQSHNHEISLPSFVFDKDDLPVRDDSETDEDNGLFLSLPEQVCETESEYDTESNDESDSAFFSLLS